MAGGMPSRTRFGGLFPRKRCRQIAEFGLHFGGIGYGIRDLLAKEFTVPLAKPVNRYFERAL